MSAPMPPRKRCRASTPPAYAACAAAKLSQQGANVKLDLGNGENLIFANKTVASLQGVVGEGLFCLAVALATTPVDASCSTARSIRSSGICCRRTQPPPMRAVIPAASVIQRVKSA